MRPLEPMRIIQRRAENCLPPGQTLFGNNLISNDSKVEENKQDSNNSKRVFIPGTQENIQVPMREITLSSTQSSDKQTTENLPVRVYDTSGPWGDASFHGKHELGLPRLREVWIEKRGDTEIIDGRKSTPADNGYLSDLHARRSEEKAQDCRLRRSEIFTRRSQKGRPVTQLQYAKNGIITQKWSLLQFVKMKVQTISENLECSSTNHKFFAASASRRIFWCFYSKRDYSNSLGVRLQEEEQLFQPTSIIPS